MTEWLDEGATHQVAEPQELTRFERFCRSLEPLFTPWQFRFCLFVAALACVLLIVAAIIATLRPPDPAIYPQIWAFPPFSVFWYVTLYGMFRVHSWRQQRQQGSVKERVQEYPFGRFLVASQPEWVWGFADFFEKHLSRYFLMVFVIFPLMMAVIALFVACS
jgi:hypothetical protein